MKKPTREERKHRCERKRRYRSEGEALDAAIIVGKPRRLKAYRCSLCGSWHLASL